MLDNEDNREKISNVVAEKFEELDFIIEANWDGDAENICVEDIEFDDLHILSVGHKECTVAFEAYVDFSAYVSYDDLATAVYDSSEDFVMSLRKIKGTVTDGAFISGIFKFKSHESWKNIEEITILEISQDVITINSEPAEID